MKKSMKITLIMLGLGLIAGALCGSVHNAEQVCSNVFEKVRHVYLDGEATATDEAMLSRFLCVRGGGIHNELEGLGLIAIFEPV